MNAARNPSVPSVAKSLSILRPQSLRELRVKRLLGTEVAAAFGWVAAEGRAVLSFSLCAAVNSFARREKPNLTDIEATRQGAGWDTSS